METNLASLLVLAMGVLVVRSVEVPPKITKQGPKDIYYKADEYVQMTCEAFCVPSCSFHWQRAGKDYTPEGNDVRVVMLRGKGTLLINSPEDKDEGFYQCFASNDYGIAATIMYNLRWAKLDAFAQTAKEIVHDVHLGEHLKMDCQSPDSVPDANVTWNVFHNNGEPLMPLLYDDRLSVDLRDNLHITFVTRQDGSPGVYWQCSAYNHVMRGNSMGPRHRINVIGSTASKTDMQVVFPMSLSNQHALVGEALRLKCIFAGNPIPFVRWQRKDGLPLPVKAMSLSYGQELMVPDVQMSDGGTYTCYGVQENEQTTYEMSFDVQIEESPYWIRSPQDLIVDKGGSAEIECLAYGIPEPQTYWFVNGRKLEDALKNDTRLDSRFTVLKRNKLRFINLNEKDSMVFQCNVTNKNGYVWGESYINIVASRPGILHPPEVNKKVAEGQPIRMSCDVTGRPTVTWYKEGVQVTGGRFVVMDNGDLEVKRAVLSDSGPYRCHAQNDWGEAEAEGSLIVRRKTLIERRPRDLEVRRNTNAKFTCTGTTDPEETDNLSIIWQKDGNTVDITTNMFINRQDNSLTVSGTGVRDTGTYTCVVSNGLDNDTASARLLVTDVPERVTSVEVLNTCTAGNRAWLEWTPGSFNNAPIQYFTVEYRSTIDPNRWIFAQKINNRKASANLSLSNGIDYSFRVSSFNKVGQSSPSSPSTSRCVTTNDRPAQNPRNVRTIGDMFGRIHIEWTPVPPEYHGETSFDGSRSGLTYTLTLRGWGSSDNSQQTQRTSIPWQQTTFNMTVGRSYHPYNITLQSINSKGQSKEQVKSVVGYSFEDRPTVTPSSLQVSDVTPTSAMFTWTFPRGEIGRPDSRVKGDFRGFMVTAWQKYNPEGTIRSWTILPNMLSDNFTGDIFEYRINNLLPKSHLEARIALRNNFYISDASDVIAFDTPAGLPGPVEHMEDINIGDTHVNLQWRKPIDDQGDIIGYDIGYREVNGLHLGETQERDPQIHDQFTNNAMLSGLKPSTKYRIYLWARTIAGRGDEYYIERETRSPIDPLIPRFSISTVTKHLINVTWWRDAYMDSSSEVYVEYKKENGREWYSTTPNVARDYVVLTTLESGTRYMVRLVSTNGGYRRVSVEDDVMTDGSAAAYDIIDNLGWFLALLFSLALQVALLVVFIICYRRGFRFKSSDVGARTYRDDDYTGIPTNKAQIPRVSEYFDHEPAGHTNDYYNSGGRDVNSGEEQDDEFGFNDYKGASLSDEDRYQRERYEHRPKEHYDDDDRRGNQDSYHGDYDTNYTDHRNRDEYDDDYREEHDRRGGGRGAAHDYEDYGSDNRQGYNSSDIDDVLEDRRDDRQGGRGHSRGVVQELRGRGTADRWPKVTEGSTSDGASSAAGHNTFV